MSKLFPITNRTKLTRYPVRGSYDEETIFGILDEAFLCTISFVIDGEPYQIPTAFCRILNRLYIHGSVGSHYLRVLAKTNNPVCIGVTLLDGFVLSRSAFGQSANYRSVIIFSKPEVITDQNELENIFKVFTNKICHGRWDDIRKPSVNEWKATMTLSFSIEEASAKIRTGPPNDSDEDCALAIWAGVQPLKMIRMPVVADPKLKNEIPLPHYLKTKSKV